MSELKDRVDKIVSVLQERENNLGSIARAS